MTACACGAPVFIQATGECGKCYDRRRYLERTAEQRAEKPERFVIEDVAFITDAELETAGRRLLGVVLSCESCSRQLGPVRSSVEAAAVIRVHLRQDHNLDIRSALCGVQGCEHIRTLGGLCREHRRTTGKGQSR